MRLYGVGSLGLRYFNVYVPKQDPNSPYSGVMSYFMDAYKKNKELTIFGDGKQSRDFIYIDDVVKANWLALQSNFTGVLNIATGGPKTLLDIISEIEAAGSRPAQQIFAQARPGDIKHSYAEVKMAKQHLNFSSSVSLQEGA